MVNDVHPRKVDDYLMALASVYGSHSFIISKISCHGDPKIISVTLLVFFLLAVMLFSLYFRNENITFERLQTWGTHSREGSNSAYEEKPIIGKQTSGRLFQDLKTRKKYEDLGLFSNEDQSRTVSNQKWPNLKLFLPVFPGGEMELKKELLRFLRFFWPKSSLRILALVDEEIPLTTRDAFVERLKKLMKRHAESTEVKFNFIPKETFGKGHDRQQLLMFWADNFTNAEYVGFIDDDTLFTNHILVEDVFDKKGRPHVWGYHDPEYYWQNMAIATRWTDNSDVEVMRTMLYFPVVVKTSHLKIIRASILHHHPEFRTFDDFFRRGLIAEERNYSQFNIMHQHLWKLKRDEYNWHLAANSMTDNHFRSIEGVTEQMTFPKPQCSLHFNYDRRKKKKSFLKFVLRRGFCYSLTKEEFDAGGEYSQLCEKAGYSWRFISATPNVDQWVFEDFDWRWDNRTLEAHIERMSLNRARSDWNKRELKRIFV